MKEENLMMEAKKYKAKRTPQRRKGGQGRIAYQSVQKKALSNLARQLMGE